MNRIENVREKVDELLLNMDDSSLWRSGYIHLYGVSQASAMIAMKREENVELAAIAGMLHDIYTYTAKDSQNHAQHSSVMAKEILESLKLFTAGEIHLICTAIYHHSNKEKIHSAFGEVLIDGDILQHCLYSPLFQVMDYEKERYEKLKAEFQLNLYNI